MRLAFLFPGQNSQQVGMGASIAQAYPEIKSDYFDRADQVLGFELSKLCFEGPAEELVKTENQQPAIFLISCAVLQLLKPLRAQAVAGHSLGEYAALVAAGALEFETGLRLTRRRGELMASVSARTPGAMAAVLGLPSDQVVDICRDTPGLVEIANYNSPNQTVISGEEQPVLRASQLAREQGARRVIPLQVSAPFHCSLMEPLREQFAPNVDCADLRDPQIPVIANATGLPETDVRTVRRNLLEQLASPVRWTDSMRWLLDNGFETFIEIGPGKVLSGLMRSIAPGTTVHTAQNADSLDELLAAVPCR